MVLSSSFLGWNKCHYLILQRRMVVVARCTAGQGRTVNLKRGDFAFATTTLVVVSKQGFENGVVEPCLICIYLYHRY